MARAGYSSLVAGGTGCVCGLGAYLLADCTWGEAAWRAAVGLAGGWLLAQMGGTALRQLRRLPGAALPAVDLAENPLTEAMVAEAKQETMGSTVAAQDAAQIVSRMMKQPAQDKE